MCVLHVCIVCVMEVFFTVFTFKVGRLERESSCKRVYYAYVYV